MQLSATVVLSAHWKGKCAQCETEKPACVAADKFCGTEDGHKRRRKVHAVECTLKEGRLEKDSQP